MCKVYFFSTNILLCNTNSQCESSFDGEKAENNVIISYWKHDRKRVRSVMINIVIDIRTPYISGILDSTLEDLLDCCETSIEYVNFFWTYVCC